MRGDSVRDFYAKTLALIGLGVLAGTGALVDYWPANSPLPTPAQALQLPALATALPVPDGVFRSLPDVPVPTRRMAFAPAADVNQPDVALASFTPSDMVAASDAPEAISSPASGPVPIERDALMSSVGQEVRLSEPRRAPHATTAGPSSDAPETMSDDDSAGFIVTAFKKTGDSLANLGSIGAKTGAKTGTSILGAFRFVGGAVRKALPL